VTDHQGNNAAGVDVWLQVITWYGDEIDPELYYSADFATTDSYGFAYLECLVPPQYSDGLWLMTAYMQDPDYTLLSAQNTSTGTWATISPSFEVVYDPNQNGIYENWEMPLAQKFCPTMVANAHVSTDKWLVPEPVEIITDSMFVKRFLNSSGDTVDDIFLLTTENWDYSGLETPMLWDDPPGGTVEYLVIYHFEWAGLTGNGSTAWENAYQSERNNNYYDHTVYAHLLKYDAQTYVIQYWFFYPYNDGQNNHEGDWEHINVLVTSQDPAFASLIRVDFYFHHKVTIRHYPDFEIADNTHPIVYIGGTAAGGNYGVNTGGSYPETGKWNNIGFASADEYVFGVGPVVAYSEYVDGNPNDGRGIVILNDRDKYDYSQNPSMSWLNANIPWGHVSVSSPWSWTGIDVGNKAPVGPAHNTGWNKIGAVSGDGGYELYTDRPGPLP